MTPADAAAVVEWHYPPPYDFYDMSADPDDLSEFIAGTEKGYNFAVQTGSALVGFVSFQPHPDGIELGLGLRPDLTGVGLGVGFVQSVISFARERHPTRRIVLNVATFNERAIRVYERTGFTTTKTFMRHTNGGEWEFTEMALHTDDVE
jgi:ribosomal-protein-alanine N-acetyltransferase